MSKSFKNTYQFKVTLKGIRPPIWRRIQVPDYYTFWDLHVAIQDAMGWLDFHLHAFEIKNPKNGLLEDIGIPDDDFADDNRKTLAGWEHKISNMIQTPRQILFCTFLFTRWLRPNWRVRIPSKRYNSTTACAKKNAPTMTHYI